MGRNRLIERWGGQEQALRRNRPAASARVIDTRDAGDPHEAPLFYGQDAGLIHDLPPAAEIVGRIAAEADEIIASGFSSGADSESDPGG